MILQLILSLIFAYPVLIVCVVVAAQVSQLLDHALVPQEPTLSVNLNWTNWMTMTLQAPIPNLEQRVHNTSAMPKNCSSILQTDVVPNISVAHECRNWCRESLGQGSAFAYAFSPTHYLTMVKMTNHTSQLNILKTCWKVETAAWAQKWMPHVWLMYFYSLSYGSISAFTLLYLLYVNHCPRELAYSNFLECDTAQSSVESSGLGEANWSLYFGVLGTLVDPGLDVLSVLTFLHNGQPYFAFFVIIGQLLSLAQSCDPFQLKGARAAAESLQQGFASEEFLKHKSIERHETFFTTTVQVYAVLTFDVSAVQLFTVLNLMGGAIFSILVSLPSQQQARWILTAPPVPIDLWDAEEVERVKAMQPWQGIPFVQLYPFMVAFGFLSCFTQLIRTPAAWLGPVWDGWQVSILSVMVSLFRLMTLVSWFGWWALGCSAFCTFQALKKQGLIHQGMDLSMLLW